MKTNHYKTRDRVCVFEETNTCPCSECQTRYMRIKAVKPTGTITYIYRPSGYLEVTLDTEYKKLIGRNTINTHYSNVRLMGKQLVFDFMIL